jgi:HEAT repeat protein
MGAIFTLAKMQNASAIEPLITALTDKDLLIRKRAMSALVDKGEAARAPLIWAASTANPELRFASEQVLEQINRRQKP